MKQKNKSSLTDSIREIFTLLFHGQFRQLLISPTDNGLLQFFRYCFVGGVATIVDWGLLYITQRLGLHYMIAAVVGFLGGLSCNYCLSKLLVFNGQTAKVDPKREFIAYCIIGVAGLGITLVLMHVMTEWLHFYFMISKMIATVLVLIWNYMARKLLLYTK